MSPTLDRLQTLLDSVRAGRALRADDRDYIHNAYWSGDKNETILAVDILAASPKPLDLPVLLDASSLENWWVMRCGVADALSQLRKEGPGLLAIMRAKETHPVVRFYIERALIDLDDPSMGEFLEGPIPPNSAPYRRSLWVYGNFQRGWIERDQALGYVSRLLEDPRRRFDWIRDYVLDQGPDE
ncbi:MAG: hypothetical protein GC165_11060 [Armatimonadetes bacterium]|nr:hypothetical protein [Armatimonadota bacterium]